MMRFNNAVGNPPYQKVLEKGSKNYMAPIYPDFMELAYTIAARAVLITPARFLFNAGATRKTWNRKMLNDKHLRVIHYEQDSAGVFGNTDIKGGVAVTYRDEGTIGDVIGFFTPFETLGDIVRKVDYNAGSLSDIIYSYSRYRFNEALHDENPSARARLSDSGAYTLKSNTFDNLPDIFTTDAPAEPYIRVYGRTKASGRVYRYVKESYIKTSGNFKQWKIASPVSNGGDGIGGKAISVIGKAVVVGPNTAHTQTFLSIGAFDSKKEADNCLKYAKTKFARAMIATLKVTQSNAKPTWKYVPLQDFTEQSDIDWTKTVYEIDKQLYEKYNLNEEEIAFIESKIKPMD